MPTYVIPEPLKPAVRFLAALTPQKRSEINGALLGMPANSDSTDIAQRLAEILKLNPENALDLVQQFYLGLFQNAHAYGNEKVFDDFLQAVKGEFPNVEWADFFDEVKKVLDSQLLSVAHLYARAENIQAVSDHAFLNASVVTSLVPFQAPEKGLIATVSHELKIFYSHGMNQDFFTATLIERDVEFLLGLLNKAQEFGGAITNFVKEGNLKILTRSEK